MSSEVHKYIETAIEKKESLLNAAVINFPNDLKPNKNQVFVDVKGNKTWKLYDRSNKNEDGDQLKTVVGICLMFTSLIIMGLFSI